MKTPLRFIGPMVTVAVVLIACSTISLPFTATNTQTSKVTTGNEPYQIKGSFDYTNAIIDTYYVENAVALVDMYGFVTRNQKWEIPVASQTLGFLTIDRQKKHGTYTLQLPARPTGTVVNVAHDGKAGLQVFAVTYWPNLTGGPFSEGDDTSYGWPNYLASVKVDSTNNDEVTGGKLVVWSPDGGQSFPTDFGADGKLFTKDDPVAAIPAGYTIVDLDQKPFTFAKASEPDVTLYEPTDYAVKDFSKLSYTQAFDQMFQFVRTDYAFNGIQGKQPNWDALYSQLTPRVQDAEQKKDPSEFYLALRDFTWAFKDGHTGLNGGDVERQAFSQATSSGYGFTLRELDDGRVLVIFVLDNGPAAKAGMKVSAVVTAFNGKPIGDAIAAVQPWTLPMSTDWAIRYQQARYLLRTTPGTKASVTFTNPGGQAQTVTLTAIGETASFSRASVYYGVDASPVLPVDFKILDSGIGYVRINSNYDDLNLIIRLFQRALDSFKANNVPGIIIDMRYNSGGAPLGLAGFLTDKTIVMGQAEQYNDATGKYEPQGVPDEFRPNVEQYHFDKMVLLVGQACYSACEEESYGFSQVPGMIVVGQTSTSGTFADVARGQIDLPEGFSLQVPTIRFKLPDGSLFLEGTGVQPTIRVPVNEQTALSSDDVVLQAGIQAVLTPSGSGVVPSAPPTIMSVSDTQSELSSAKEFTQLAREQYTNQDMLKVPGTFTYTITLSQSQPLLWDWVWCAKDPATLSNNLGKIKLSFSLNDAPVGLDKFYKTDFTESQSGQACTAYVAALTNWQAGENHAVTTAEFTVPVNDGASDYPAGKQVFDYKIFVAP
jgi:C-terminal processing protease CtpA/Prc